MDRFKWKSENDEILRQLLEECDEGSMLERISRLRFLKEEFGPEADMMIYGGIPALLSLSEIKAAYINAIDVSVIYSAHVFAEQTLGSILILAGKDKEAEAGLSKIIETALEMEVINSSIAENLRELKNMRIAYFHAHVGIKNRSYMGRRMTTSHMNDAILVEEDSIFAIRTVVDLIRYMNPQFKPGFFGDDLGN